LTPALAILCYHRLVEEDELETAWPYIERGTAVRIANFHAQLSDIARFADVVSERQVLDVLAGRRHLSRPAVWLTFDDGYRDALRAARHATTGTVFITSCVTERSLPADAWYDVLITANRTRGSIDLGFGTFSYDLHSREERARLVDGPERRAYLRSPANSQAATLHALAMQLDAPAHGLHSYLGVEEMRGLLSAGWSLGSHGLTHTPFDAIGPEDVMREARESLLWLSAMNVQVSSISLPNGVLPRDLVDLHACGYECVLGLGNLPAELGAVVQPRFLVPDDRHWVNRVLQPTLTAGSS